MVQEAVTEEEIAKIISRWTGIPIAKLTEGEREKTLHLADELHKRVVGQDEAVEKVTEAILRSKAGICFLLFLAICSSLLYTAISSSSA